MPNGDILLCENIADAPVVGSIFDESTIQREKFIKRGREKEEICAACSLLPVCTDFMGCPNCKNNCVEERMAVEKNKLRDLSDEKRLPPITVDINGETIRIVEPTRQFAEQCTPILTDGGFEEIMTMTQDKAENL